MGKKEENSNFICENCNREVARLENGSVRNHCNFCLWSKHVDIIPGDRKSDCHALMEPVEAHYNTKKGYQIVHKCVKCGHEQKNKLAIDCENGDNMQLYYNLMTKAAYKK